MRSAEVIALLKKQGWTVKAQKGSHLQLTHIGKPGKVTVPHPKPHLSIGTLRAIWKQAGLAWPPGSKE